MTSKFNFKLLPISHLAFHFQNQTPLLPAFFFKNLPFWPNSYKINPPQKILFLPKKKGHVSISPQIDLFVSPLICRKERIRVSFAKNPIPDVDIRYVFVIE
jgi:hypothetical protein